MVSLRLGLYDFFSYTIPGIFYLLIAAYSAALFGWITVDLSVLNQISFLAFIFLIGVGYVVGLLFSHWTVPWFQLFRRTPTSEAAHDEFCERHPNIEPLFTSEELHMVLSLVHKTGDDYTVELERFNVYSIMTRNISFGLFLLALVHIIYFVLTATVWSAFTALVLVGFAIVAVRQSILFQRWFYLYTIETAAVEHLEAPDLFEYNIDSQSIAIDISDTSTQTTDDQG